MASGVFEKQAESSFVTVAAREFPQLPCLPSIGKLQYFRPECVCVPNHLFSNFTVIMATTDEAFGTSSQYQRHSEHFSAARRRIGVSARKLGTDTQSTIQSTYITVQAHTSRYRFHRLVIASSSPVVAKGRSAVFLESLLPDLKSVPSPSERHIHRL